MHLKRRRPPPVTVERIMVSFMLERTVALALDHLRVMPMPMPSRCVTTKSDRSTMYHHLVAPDRSHHRQVFDAWPSKQPLAPKWIATLLQSGDGFKLGELHCLSISVSVFSVNLLSAELFVTSCIVNMTLVNANSKCSPYQTTFILPPISPLSP